MRGISQQAGRGSVRVVGPGAGVRAGAGAGGAPIVPGGADEPGRGEEPDPQSDDQHVPHLAEGRIGVVGDRVEQPDHRSTLLRGGSGLRCGARRSAGGVGGRGGVVAALVRAGLDRGVGRVSRRGGGLGRRLRSRLRGLRRCGGVGSCRLASIGLALGLRGGLGLGAVLLLCGGARLWVLRRGGLRRLLLRGRVVRILGRGGVRRRGGAGISRRGGLLGVALVRRSALLVAVVGVVGGEVVVVVVVGGAIFLAGHRDETGSGLLYRLVLGIALLGVVLVLVFFPGRRCRRAFAHGGRLRRGRAVGGRLRRRLVALGGLLRRGASRWHRRCRGVVALARRPRIGILGGVTRVRGRILRRLLGLRGRDLGGV